MAIADLETKRKIDEQADALLEQCDAFFAIDRVEQVFLNNKDFGRRQIRSLLDAAGEAFSVRELQAYLRYKVSRKGGWEEVCGGLPLGEQLCRALDRVRAMAEELFPGEPRLAMRLVEKFLGYVYWKASSLGAAGQAKGGGA